jgi:hypothetical protein
LYEAFTVRACPALELEDPRSRAIGRKVSACHAELSKLPYSRHSFFELVAKTRSRRSGPVKAFLECFTVFAIVAREPAKNRRQLHSLRNLLFPLFG